VDESLSDLYVVPVYKTAFLNPFDSKSLDFICRYMTKDGELAPFALDNILASASRLFRKRSGLELRALGEIEFFLIFDQERTLFPMKKQHGYHESSPFAKGSNVLNQIIRAISQATGSVKYGHHEVGAIDQIESELNEINGKSAEQLEVEFLPQPIETAGDTLSIARWIIRNIAYQHGCVAVFSPKIEEGIAGNGLHFHLDMTRDRKNIMVDQKGELSVEARKLIGGLCEYADSLTAFGNTVASSYLRLVPNHEAPTKVFWSDLNRSALIRVPLGWAGVENLASRVNPQEKKDFPEQSIRQTVELRSADGSALVSLVLAGIAMAADWGFENARSLDLAKARYGSPEMSLDDDFLESLPSLPSSCVQSSQILEKKRSLYERNGIFPPGIIDYVIRILKAEKDDSLSSEWDRLSEKERAIQVRKIMHRDLHKH